MSVRERVNPCVHVHEQSESGMLTLQQAFFFLMKNYTCVSPCASPLPFLLITECPLYVLHHYETEEFTLTSEHNHPPNDTNQSRFLNRVILAVYALSISSYSFVKEKHSKPDGPIKHFFTLPFVKHLLNGFIQGSNLPESPYNMTC